MTNNITFKDSGFLDTTLAEMFLCFKVISFNLFRTEFLIFYFDILMFISFCGLF